MIQRIQTLYMALVAIFTIVTYFSIGIWEFEGTAIYSSDVSYLPINLGLIAGLAVFAILQYKKRQLQFVLNRLNIILNLILMVVILLPAYSEYNTVNLENLPVKIANGGIVPLINIVLLFFANRGIKRDEALIKSIDRIR